MTALAPIRLERPGTPRLAVLPPLSIYVHIPWCLRKCPYCDFNSHETKDTLPEGEYVDALFGDLELLLPSIWGRRAVSIFIGGGTPSLFSPASIERLLSGLRARLPLEPGAEITLEANPGTVEAERFRDYADAGVNRLSIGVQSFDDAQLAALGRIHSAHQARRALDLAMTYFDNVNIDLMYGLPGQSLAQAQADLSEAARIGATQISAYQLTIETNTAFYRRPPVLPEHDLCADMQRMAENALAAAGYGHYETSAFARPGKRCRHNLNYWRFGDYLGLGAGAHGKLSFADRITRHARIKAPHEYLAGARRGSTLAEERTVSAPELPLEFMLNALRLTEGFDEALFPLRTGLPGAAIAAPLASALEQGLIERDGVRLRPSERGRLFLNDLLALFLDKD
ncbi:MAG: radical SAM family heme chaperone HemW [Betaproteobacteria bacterium]|nr:radical SAM family heme chaperone HemW [Betaproteobacteria bacterium]